MTSLVRREDIIVKPVLASIDGETGTRLDTLQLRYPRIIHSEFMTHRVFSRNAASSRAIPTASLLKRDADIFIPCFKKNKAGMQPAEFLSEREQEEAEGIWRDMASYVAERCQILADKHGLNVAKQWTNRPLEWFGYIDVLVSSTDWANFDALRDHDAAQDEIRLLCVAMKEAREAALPHILRPGEWHLPYVKKEDREFAEQGWMPHTAAIKTLLEDTAIFYDTRPWTELLLIMSAARCCRLSYSKHDGFPSTLDEDIDRFRKLVPSNAPVHASPLEHQATPLGDLDRKYQGNFRDFAQFRQFVPRHCVFN